MAQRTGIDDLVTAFTFVSGVVFLTDLAMRAKNANDAKNRHKEVLAAIAKLGK
jgi:hypothetical protein